MRSSGGFPTTHWSHVARASDGSRESQEVALEQLLRRYLPALRAHVVRVLRVPADDVDDLVQGFICDRIVAEGLIAGADQNRGKFRTYLLTALDRHVARVRRYDRAAKRSPSAPSNSLDDDSVIEPTAGPIPSETFDIAWAKQVVAQAIEQMRKECSSGRPDIWGVFQARVLSPMLEGTEPTPYPQLVESLRLVSADVAANLTVTGKRMFARHLRAIVGQYASDAEIEQEIAELRQILAGK